MKQIGHALFVIALALFLLANVHASTIKFFGTNGALIYECERTGDAVIFPSGLVQVECGGNTLTFPGAAAFFLSSIAFDASQAPALPVTRSGGTFGTLSASLSVSGPCVVDPETVTFANGATSPSAMPHIAALSGTMAARCSVSMGAASLSASVTDLTCKP